MELCAKGDLRGRIEKLKDIGAALTEASLMKILIQVLIALDVLHLARFLHRDLKPENIFVDEKDDVKIGDVGCAKELDSTEAVAQTQVGTPPYESPEVVKGEEYNSSADMWSVGVLLYELIMLERPFGGMKTFQLNQAILAGKYKPIPKGRCPTEVIVIVEALLNMNAQLHPSARKLLQNPFIRAHAAVLKDASGKSLLTYLPAAAPPAEKRDLFVYVGSVARVALLLRVTPDTTFQTIREMIAKEAFMSLTVLRLVKTFKGEIISDWATVGGINTEEIYAYEDFPLTSITIANKGDEFRIVVNGQMKIEEVFDAIHKERPNLYGEYLTYQRRAADGSYRIVRIDSHGGMLVQHNVKQGEVMEPGYYFGKKIYVRTLTNGLMPFPLLCVNDTVEALKKKIFERLGIESRIQKLIYNGRELDNSWKLSDYDIQNHSFIYMITKK